MADPTLTRTGGSNFLTGTPNTTLTLYNAQIETMRKDANLIGFPIPGGDDTAQVVFDLLGVTREFIIRGTFTTTDDADAYKFHRDLASLVDGGQGDTGGGESGYVFRSRLWNDGASVQTDDIQVYVKSVESNWKAGESNDVEYSLTLMTVNESGSG